MDYGQLEGNTSYIQTQINISPMQSQSLQSQAQADNPPQTLSLSLLNPYLLLIPDLPVALPQEMLACHQLIHSKKHAGYATRLKMLNSLKRCFEEMRVRVNELPNIVFKMWKGLGTGAATSRKPNPKPKATTKSSGVQFVGKWVLAIHQIRAVEFFLANGRKMILGDGWNLGKTVTCLACCQKSKCKKILILTHSHRLAHWIDHIRALQSPLTCQQYGPKQTTRTRNPTIKLRIIDFAEQNAQNSGKATTPFAPITPITLKMETVKSEVKLKSEEFGDAVEYVLCCYPMFLGGKDTGSGYGMVVLDYPCLDDNDPTINSLITKLSEHPRIESILINSPQIGLCKTRMLLPLLNPRMNQNQIQCRYGPTNSAHLLNEHEYINAVHRFYLKQTSNLQVRTPSPTVIKHVLVDLGTWDLVNFLKAYFENATGLVLVAVSDEQLKKQIIICLNTLHTHYFIGSIPETTHYLQQCNNKMSSPRPKCLVIPHPSAPLGACFLPQLCTLHQYTNIECLTYCHILREGQEDGYRIEMMARGCEGEVSSRAIVRNWGGVHEISSEGEGHNQFRDPQRYFEDTSSQYEMVDEQHQIPPTQVVVEPLAQPQVEQIYIISDSSQMQEQVQIVSNTAPQKQETEDNQVGIHTDSLVQQSEQFKKQKKQQNSKQHEKELEKGLIYEQDQEQRKEEEGGHDQALAYQESRVPVVIGRQKQKQKKERTTEEQEQESMKTIIKAKEKQKPISKRNSKPIPMDFNSNRPVTRTMTRNANANLIQIDSSVSVNKSNKSISIPKKYNRKQEQHNTLTLPIQQPQHTILPPTKPEKTNPRPSPIESPHNSPQTHSPVDMCSQDWIQIESQQSGVEGGMKEQPRRQQSWSRGAVGANGCRPKIKSKQVLSIKLVPKISFLDNYSNHSDNTASDVP